MGAPLRAALEVLERRLDACSRAPVAVAFSGGGDSLGLLLAAKAFAEARGRPLIALHVDHGLQPQSAAWADLAARAADRLHVSFQKLAWVGPRPRSGVPAAARAARHRLLAEAARRAGAPVILVGHTLDDQLENAVMRGSGERVGVLAEWSASPVWPQGRGVFLCRPLLNVRRADIRSWLAGKGLAWIEDPANEDPRHPRARARKALASGAEVPSTSLEAQAPRTLGALWRIEPWGDAVLDREGLVRADPPHAVRLLQMAAACVSGVEALPRPDRAGHVLGRLAAGEQFVAGLGGARLQALSDRLVIGREAGEAARGGLAPLELAAGETGVWDGRFEVRAQEAGVVEPLRGQGARLSPQDRARLKAVPAAARPGLPIWRKLDASGAVLRLALIIKDTHIDVDNDNGVLCRALSEERLAGAAGVVTKEAEIGQSPAWRIHLSRPM